MEDDRNITPKRRRNSNDSDEAELERKRAEAAKRKAYRDNLSDEKKEEIKRRERERRRESRAREKAAASASTSRETSVERTPSKQPVLSRNTDQDVFVTPKRIVRRPASAVKTESESDLQSEGSQATPRRGSSGIAEGGKAEERQGAEESTPVREARLLKERERSAARIANETPEQERARLDDQQIRSAARISNETLEQRRSRQDADNQRKETRRAGETDEEHKARIAADIARRKKREREIEQAQRRKALDAARRRRVREKMRNADSSDSEDGEDHIQSPRTVDPLDIGPRKPCDGCGAMIFGTSKFCCNNATVAIPPEEKYEEDMEELMYGTGPLAKEFKKKILNYSSCFGLASIARKNEPVAKHGLPVAKVKGAIDAYPSTAFPYKQNHEAFGNIFVYEGKEAIEMRMKYGHDLNREVVEKIQKCLAKNKLGQQYKNMKEVMDDLNPDEPPSAVRLKIINAWNVDNTKLQGHKGIYRTENQDSLDFVAVFYRATVEQRDIELPGLIGQHSMSLFTIFGFPDFSTFKP